MRPSSSRRGAVVSLVQTAEPRARARSGVPPGRRYDPRDAGHPRPQWDRRRVGLRRGRPARLPQRGVCDAAQHLLDRRQWQQGAGRPAPAREPLSRDGLRLPGGPPRSRRRGLSDPSALRLAPGSRLRVAVPARLSGAGGALPRRARTRRPALAGGVRHGCLCSSLRGVDRPPARRRLGRRRRPRARAGDAAPLLRRGGLGAQPDGCAAPRVGRVAAAPVAAARGSRRGAGRARLCAARRAGTAGAGAGARPGTPGAARRAAPRLRRRRPAGARRLARHECARLRAIARRARDGEPADRSRRGGCRRDATPGRRGACRLRAGPARGGGARPRRARLARGRHALALAAARPGRGARPAGGGGCGGLSAGLAAGGDGAHPAPHANGLQRPPDPRSVVRPGGARRRVRLPRSGLGSAAARRRRRSPLPSARPPAARDADAVRDERLLGAAHAAACPAGASRLRAGRAAGERPRARPPGRGGPLLGRARLERRLRPAPERADARDGPSTAAGRRRTRVRGRDEPCGARPTARRHLGREALALRTDPGGSRATRTASGGARRRRVPAALPPVRRADARRGRRLPTRGSLPGPPRPGALRPRPLRVPAQRPSASSASLGFTRSRGRQARASPRRAAQAGARIATMSRARALRGFLRRHRVETLLFAAFWVSFACVLHTRPGWNVNSRLALTFAVVERGTLSIDAYHDREATGTNDKAYFRGHYYSDKSPALSLLAVPFYAVARPFLAASDEATRVVVARQWCTAWTVGLLGALAAALFYHLMRLFGATGDDALALTVFLVYGTNFGGYTSLFYAYAPATACLLLAYVLAVSARSGAGGKLSPERAAAIGLLISMAGFLEFTFGLAGAVLLGLTLATLRPRRRLAWIAAGALPPLAALLAYQHAIFGEFSLAYSHYAMASFREGMATGWMGISRPNLGVLYYITIHPYRGLFFYSPVLLFFFVGSGQIWRRAKSRRPDLLAAWAALVAYLLFNSSYYTWWGGWAMGPRYLIGMLPFLFLPILAAMQQGPRMRNAVLAAGCVSVALNLPVILVDPQIPEGYPPATLLRAEISSNLTSPWLTRTLSDFFRGQIAVILPLAKLSGLWPLVPLALLWAAVLPTARRWGRA